MWVIFAESACLSYNWSVIFVFLFVAELTSGKYIKNDGLKILHHHEKGLVIFIMFV